jgi:mannosyltransferase
MSEFSTLFAILRSHRKLVYVSLASFSLLCLFWTPQIQTSTLWSTFEKHKSTEKAPPYTAAIIYLVTIPRTAEHLESLASINRNLPGHPWPVILFHTGEFDHDSIRLDFVGRIHDYIGPENGSLAFTKRVEFVKLDWQLPKGIAADKETVDPVDSYRWPGKSAMVVLSSTPRC